MISFKRLGSIIEVEVEISGRKGCTVDNGNCFELCEKGQKHRGGNERSTEVRVDQC